MNCCTTKTSTLELSSPVDGPSAGERASECEIQPCAQCQSRSRPVSRKTILLMVKPDLLEQARHGNYRFCFTPGCPVVYFEEEGKQQFTIEDLRIRVGLKVEEDPIPLCYCFGFDESHLREEIARTGQTTIPETISKLIRERMCACDARNPSGMCCLGEVSKTAQLLKIRLSKVHRS
jgi:hypothetical protein